MLTKQMNLLEIARPLAKSDVTSAPIKRNIKK
jgi:hypothetical protein